MTEIIIQGPSMHVFKFDENYNMIPIGVDEFPRQLCEIFQYLIGDSTIIDKSLIGLEVDNIYSYLVEKYFLDHAWATRKISSIVLDEPVKFQLRAAFNKFIFALLENQFGEEVEISYEKSE